MTNTNTQPTDLPKGWVLIDTGDALTKSPTTGKKVKQKDYLTQGLIPVIDQGQELIGGYTNDTSKKIDCELPVIVFGDHTKTVKFINFEFVPGADGVKIIRPIEAFDPKLFTYFLIVLVKKIPDKGYARHFQHIEKTTIPLPPLAEQQRIVAKIEELFSDLDYSIAALETARAQLKIYRQAVLKYAFEGKLTEKWRTARKDLSGFQNLTGLDSAAELLARIQAERAQNGKPAKPLPPLTEAELAELPSLLEGWMWEKLDNIAADMCLGKMLDKQKNKGKYQPYLRNINVRWGRFDLSDLLEMRFEAHEEERYGIREGDLIICEGGEPGRAAIWKNQIPRMKIQKALHRVRLFDESLLNTFVLYFLKYSSQTGHLERYFTGTTIKHLTGSGLANLAIPVCSYEEQNAIVAEIESRLSVIDKLEETIETSLQQAEALRQSILKQAFAGKLVPQDPADEPAEVLLERIKNKI